MEISDEDDAEALLFYLVYCSRAVKTLEAVEMEQLLSGARRNNARHQITGWLVYSSGIFFQWLEGDRAAVKGLMASITADPRHKDVVVLDEEEEVRERLFSGWDMEFVLPEDIRAVIQDAIGATDDSRKIRTLQQLVRELDSKDVATNGQ